MTTTLDTHVVPTVKNKKEKKNCKKFRREVKIETNTDLFVSIDLEIIV